MDNTPTAPDVFQEAIDQMGEHLHSRFMDFIKDEDLETSKALMDEWVVDGVDPYDGEVEFIWVDEIHLD